MFDKRSSRNKFNAAGFSQSRHSGDIFEASGLAFTSGTRIRMDPRHPWCTDTLMTAMRQETSMLINHAFRNDVSATELLLADYTFINEELADIIVSRIRALR